MLADRPRKPIRAEERATVARARRPACRRTARSGGARPDPAAVDRAQAAFRAPRRHGSSRRTPRARAARRSSAIGLPKPPTNPFTPTIPTLAPSIAKDVCCARARGRPRSPSARTSSAGRSECQSWLPSTATTGHGETAAGIREHVCLVQLAVRVRSPARRTRSAWSSIRANASRTGRRRPCPHGCRRRPQP